MKKLAIITPNLEGGGAEKVAIHLANHISRSGYLVDLVTFEDKADHEFSPESTVSLINLKTRKYKNIWELNTVYSLRKYLIESKPDTALSVLTNSNIILGMSGIGLKSPRIIFHEPNTLHGLTHAHPLRRLSYLLRVKISYRRSNFVIANSMDTLNDLVSGNIISPDKGTVVGNPVVPDTLSDFISESVSHKFFNDDNDVIISIGRLEVQKNFPHLIRSFRKVIDSMPNTRLLILGQGSQYERLVSLIRELDLDDHVDLAGFKNNIYPYLVKSRVFALSSSWEGFGNVIVEALSTGLPVVCTDCPGGPKEILRGGEFGTLVPPNNEIALARAIMESINKQADKPNLIKRSLDFSIEKISSQYLDILFPDKKRD